MGTRSIVPAALLFLCACSTGAESISEEARKAIFEAPEFAKEITLNLPCGDAAVMDQLRKRFPPPGTHLGSQMLPAFLTAHTKLTPDMLRFLTATGFAKVETWTWPANYGQETRGFVLYTGSSPCPVVDGSVTNCERSFTLLLGERKVKEVTYTNRFKRNLWGTEVDVAATTFIYTMEWKCSGMPPVEKVFEAKGEAFLDPRGGKWRSSLSFRDGGSDEFMLAVASKAPAGQPQAKAAPAPAPQREGAASGDRRSSPPADHPIIGAWRWPREYLETRDIVVPPYELYFLDIGRVTQYAPSSDGGEYIDYRIDGSSLYLRRLAVPGGRNNECDGCPEECSGCLLDAAREYRFAVAGDKLTLEWKDKKTGATETIRYKRLTVAAPAGAVHSKPEDVVGVLLSTAKSGNFSQLPGLCPSTGENDHKTMAVCNLGNGPSDVDTRSRRGVSADEFVAAFRNAEIIGMPRVKGASAEVDIVFDDLGKQRPATIRLMQRSGNWYLASF